MCAVACASVHSAATPAYLNAPCAPRTQIAANDDICREAMESGGTDTLLELMRGATEARAAGASSSPDQAAAADADADAGADVDSNGNGAGAGGAAAGRDAAVELARGAAGALRQLANSDAVKSQLAELGALEAIIL